MPSAREIPLVIFRRSRIRHGRNLSQSCANGGAMERVGRRLGPVLLATLLCCVSGCFGVSQNPSYFPHWVPFGDMIPTQAKPPGPSYYENFDTRASKLVVMPLESVSQVRTQHILLATMY